MKRSLLAAWACWSGLGAVPAAAADGVDYNRDVRPILADHCFACHGPDEAARKAGLRLDLRDRATRPSEAGLTPIVAGKPEESELIERIASDEPDRLMPPPKLGKPLSPAQKETLRRWVAAGARYQGHWAFERPQRPAPPPVKDATWPRNPIDSFVLARIEAEGLRPSPEADRVTLLRRAALDLTGLPPSPAEVDSFLADRSPDAYEKAVDRLLASERYGERMAMPWLDFARYADSNGYQSDSSRDMSPWRDWVIRAFNRNLPFDRFTVEQIAGDLLPGPTRDQLVATGFNRNHRLTSEGGSIPEEWRVETVIDRVETTSLTWLGLTLGCARCHDHKYDPVSQKEFYQFFAFFNNVPESGMVGAEAKNTEPTVAVPTPEMEAEQARLEAVAAEAGKAVAGLEKDIPRLVEAWEPEFRKQLEGTVPAWSPLEPSGVVSSGGATFTRLDDTSWLAGGTNPSNDTYTITAPIRPGAFSGLLLETLPDPSLPNGSLGRYPNGNFVLTAVEAEIAAPGPETPRKVKFASAEADYSQPNYEARFLVDDNPANGWAISGNDPEKRQPRRLVLAADAPVAVAEGSTITVRLRHDAIDRHNIGRFRLSATSRPKELVRLDRSKGTPGIPAVLNVEGQERTPNQAAELAAYFRKEIDSPVRRADQALASANRAAKAHRDSFPNSMIMRELPRPREAFLLVRGQYDRRGEPVAAGLPAALPPLPPGQPMDRLGLARWIVDPANPLTGRVWVNRAWEKFFGTGLSKTTENLGTQSEFPSHPELLDWMATEFVGLGWDMKALQRLIVTSATYRQSSRATPALIERDPENRLLARGARFRLAGEVVRDQALAVSGLLVERVGGPAVRPYMPEGVWDETTKYGNLRNYKADQGEGLYRRTLYTIWKRTAAPPTLLIFDAPNRETCTIKRSRTNTPLQALALLNEVTYVEAARKLAERMIAEGGATPEARLALGFRLATAREAEPEELQVLTGGLRADLERYRRDPASARKLIATGAARADARLDPEELAAYTLAANVLLNLDEVMTRE